MEDYVNIGDGFNHKLFASMSDYLDLDGKKHFLALIRNSKGFFCLIHLHGMFSIGVTLSHHSLFNRMGDRLKCNLHQKVQQMGTVVVLESLGEWWCGSYISDR